MNTFAIIPYETIGPIRFGASATEVTTALGAPRHKDKNRRGELVLYYEGFLITFCTENEGVVEVGMTPQVEVRLHNIDIFRASTAFVDLIAEDRSPFELLGFIILLRLGITLTGFHDQDPAQRAVTAFARGRWDHLRSQFKNYAGPAT